MQKNIASQQFVVFAFNATTNIPITGDAANITATISKDFAADVATNDVNPTETQKGFYVFDATQAETNANDIQIFPSSVTANIQVISVPGLITTVPVSFGDDIIQSADNDTKISKIPLSLGSGTAQGGTSSTIQLASSETFATNDLRGNVVKIIAGTGKGQSRWISANVGITDTCTVRPDWITTPDATSEYDIVQGSASMQAILDNDFTESTDGLLSNNFDTFFDNKNTNTIKTLDDVGTAPPLPTSGWIWSTATSGVPITGRLRGNNATIASITELSIHEVSDDGRNTSVTISSLRSGDQIQVSFETNPDIFLIFDVTATPILTGEVYAVTGTVDTTAGTFTNTKVGVSYKHTIVTNGGITTSNGSVVQTNNINGNITATITLTGDIDGSITSVTDSVTVGAIENNVISAAAIAAGALDGKGDWNIGKTGYSGTATNMRGTDGANTVVPPSVSQFNTRTILSASYGTSANQTIINDNVLLIDTATMRGTDGANTTTPPTTAQIWAEATRELTSGNNIALAKGVGVTGFNDLSASQVNAEMIDVLVTDTFTEVTVPGATASIKDMIHYSYSRIINKTTQTATTLTVRNDADSGDLGSATVSDDNTTFTKGKET